MQRLAQYAQLVDMKRAKEARGAASYVGLRRRSRISFKPKFLCLASCVAQTASCFVSSSRWSAFSDTRCFNMTKDRSLTAEALNFQKVE
jgi:hypothetical protein